MSRRKFNLGDILRKLNEGDSEHTASPPAQQQAAPPPSPSSPPDSFRRTDKPDAPRIIRQPQVPLMPEQPAAAPDAPEKKHSTTVAFNYPPVDHHDARAPAPAVQPASSPFMTDNPRTPRNEPAINHPPAAKPAQRPPAPATGTGNDEEDEEDFNVFKYIGILLRRKYVVLLVTAAAAFFSLFRYLNSDTYYSAHARLLFRPDNQGIIDEQNRYRYWGDREKMFSTHLELLKSYTVLASVARNLGGKLTPEEIGASLIIKQGETEGDKNDIIELSCTNRSAESARDILNELCKTYLDYRRDVNSQEITRLVGKFEFQIEKIQADLTKKESTLREFKESHRMVELTNETNATISKLANMETAHEQTQLDLLESRERFGALNSQISQQEHDIVQSVTYQDPFGNRIADLELELNTLTTEYSPEHFKVKMLRQQIDNLKTATADSITREAASRTLIKNPIRQALLQELVNLTIEKSALEAKRIAQEQLIERFNQELVRLPAMEQQYAFLQRETGSLLQTLSMLKTKYEEAKIRRDSEESELKILELAQTPEIRISSVKSTNVAIGILIGLILGIALALLIEYLDQTLKDPASVEKTLGVPLLGIVPFIEADNALLEHATDLTKNILEPFRALRANLKHIAATHHLQTFIVCSAIKGEGKTTLAANLGITFALDGKKVILVDGDLRRSQAHSLFAIPKQIGLTDYLLGTASVDEIIKPTKFENMSVITSGERPHNPAELLGIPRFDHLIEELRSKADFIIFDSPALLPVSDTITMAPKMDGVLFVVRTFWTPLKAAKQALNQLQRIGSHLYGGILNGASHSGKYYPYYYGYYGYYGYYSYKYSYDEDHKRPFSMRETGLRMERSAREQLTSMRFALPKLATAVSTGLNRIARKKTLWFLIVCLLAIVGTRFAFEAMQEKHAPGTIEYLGIGSIRTSDNKAGSPGTPPPAVRSVPQQTIAVDTAAGEIALTTSVNAWFKAFSQRRPDNYLSFYDRESFRFSGGAFEAWNTATTNAFNQDPGTAVIELDSTRTVSSDSVSAALLCYIKAATGSDTLRGCISTQWNLGADNTWRIVRQSTLSGAFGETGVHQ